MTFDMIMTQTPRRRDKSSTPTIEAGCLAATILVQLFSGGCSPTRTGIAHARVEQQVAAPVASLVSEADQQRLDALIAERAAQPAGEGSADGYRIGPDDLLDIRIPDLLGTATPSGATLPMRSAALNAAFGAQIFQQGLRVSADGIVNVPVLGPVHAAGLTARGLEQEIGRRLVAAGILRTPQVSVLVAEYRSRVVAVIGSVERPGLYPVTRPGATVADLLWAAGGPSKDAGRIVQFSPALSTPGERRDARVVARADVIAPLTDAPGQADTDLEAERAQPTTATLAQPIRIDLALLLPAAGHGGGLNPQVRQGDVIRVPAAGSIQVDGWVQKPGSYPITPNLTVRGALAAAGGTTFPTDLSQISVRRVLAPDDEHVMQVDLRAQSHGQQDVPLTDGDVIYAPASTARVVPWGIWNFVTTIFRVGASIVAL